MTTTERIANAIKGILEEDRRADRERIAELELYVVHARTAHHAAVVERDRLQTFVDSLNAKLDEANQRLQHMQLRIDLALSGDNELHATVDDLNRQLDEAHKENARLIVKTWGPPHEISHVGAPSPTVDRAFVVGFDGVTWAARK